MRCCLSAPLAALAAFPDPRDLVRSGAILTPAVLRSALAARRERVTRADVVTAVNLELVTLTEDSAVITWSTAVPGTDDGFGHLIPAVTEGEVVYGTHPAHLTRTASEGRPTAHHHVELTDLEPGQTYYYQARSRGRAATPTPLHLVRGNAVGTSLHGLGSHGGPYSFTTPQPPPGRHLLSVALCNDLHLGETTAGRVAGVPMLRGVSQQPGLDPYPEIMSVAMVEEAHRRGADVLLAAGDISAAGAPRDLAEARRILDGFGTHGRDYFVVRGNHDRPRHPDDSFRDGFLGGADGPGYFARDLGGLRLIGLDTYEKEGNGGDAGGLSAEQLAWFQGELRTDKDQPTIVFGHHPLTTRDSVFPMGRGQRLDRGQARSIVDAYSASPGVFLHHAGHTHRNKRTLLSSAPHVTQQEVSAVKDYPGGFCLLRVHTGGYALNYYKNSSVPARAWVERSRLTAGGMWPHHALGRSVTDRNSMRPHDLSGVRAYLRV
ncbi:metallophosphoesterase [Streptomyces turgidiscabies]|uniref:Fibronectin type III domain protein n=1 Tax=Streptomyces turgidiscabies (strain Car8) TaxID=698760 RepID=L7FIU4_STRT8|nr:MULTISPECIES: metallophosphoesterase family protein [Streptomyces]ELP71084.1 fibronectin type III domain protein [Streptomyces turgidiscabies Car8]MDX3493387.1 metallophosphoesterase family protein [Streptomyces turgidiscabies]GAQ70693.1 calcineurin-like phosphoesterase [Streptomyces turgidiscabies]